MKKLFTMSAFIFIMLLHADCSGSDHGEETVDAILRINSGEKTATNSSGSFSVFVTSNTDWTVLSDAAWLKPDRTGGKGEMDLRVYYDENGDGAARTGTLTFSAEGANPVQLKVTQTDLVFTNPIFDMPDPWIVKVDGYYYACKAGSGNGINISRSEKLSVINGTQSVWRCPSDAGGVKVWNSGNIWAPELHHIDGRWYIYYTAGRPQSETNSWNLQRSGVLRAKTDDPFGEWEDMGMLYTGDNYEPGIKPTADNTNYAIDLSVFKLGGKFYAVWSGYPTGASGQYLYIATMSDPYTITSSRVEISRPDQPWERVTGQVNEGPAFLHNKEAAKFYIVYSCNGSWTKEYRLAYLEMDDTADPMNPANWKKSPNHVFYRCDDTSGMDGVNGVGHCSFTKSPNDEEDWIVYHTKDRNSTEWGARSTFIQKFTWNDDGTPNFGTPVGRGEPVPLPAGETL